MSQAGQAFQRQVPLRWFDLPRWAEIFEATENSTEDSEAISIPERINR